MPPVLSQQLTISRCPHCRVDTPNLDSKQSLVTMDHQEQNKRTWCVYVCRRCGGPVIAGGPSSLNQAFEIFPSVGNLHEEIPAPASSYLQQAYDSLHAPAGCVMLCASTVDAMLKAKGYKEGSLYSRIDKAALENVITPDMAKWAHQVRLEANDQRHADDVAIIPTSADAKKCVDFAATLGYVLFVVPARVTRGIAESQPTVTG